MDKENLLKRYKGMKQYRDLSPEELDKIINQKLQEEEVINSFVGLKDEEKTKAIQLYNKYVSEHSFESLAEKMSLINLVRDEIIKERMVWQLQKDYEEKNEAIPLQLLKSIQEFEAHILEQKEKLGMFKSKEENNDVVSVIEDLKDRFNKWLNKPDNRANYSLSCPSCGEMILIRRKLDKEKDIPILHPWFIEGGILFNKEIFKDYKAGLITKSQVSRYLDCVEDYVDWVLSHYPMEKDKPEEESEQND